MSLLLKHREKIQGTKNKDKTHKTCPCSFVVPELYILDRHNYYYFIKKGTICTLAKAVQCVVIINTVYQMFSWFYLWGTVSRSWRWVWPGNLLGTEALRQKWVCPLWVELPDPPSVQFISVFQSYPILCDPTNRSTPGLPVHHHLLEFTQTHIHRVSDAIQPSHPLSFPSPPAPNPSQHQSLFQWVNSSHKVTKVLEFQL